MIAGGADIYVKRWQRYAKELKRIGCVWSRKTPPPPPPPPVQTLGPVAGGCGRRWGTPAAREPGLGTGRGGDVTGDA